MATEEDVERGEGAYALGPPDAVRDVFEREHFARLVPRLIAEAGAGRLLDLGCGDGLAAELAGEGLDEYVGVDLRRVDRPTHGRFVAHDLHHGLGPVGAEPYDVYLASFGLVSHLPPAELERLLREISDHARPGSIVALEALGLYSLEWPRLWDVGPGPARMLPYRLGQDVCVHPWSPAELGGALERAGIEPRWMLDRTVQAGPKLGEGRYWPGLPAVRDALCGLLEGDASGMASLTAPLPPLPAHPASALHHALVRRRRALIRCVRGRDTRAIARAVWALEPQSAGGFGHGLLAVGVAA